MRKINLQHSPLAKNLVGFSLVEIAVVLVIIGFLGVFAIGLTAGVLAKQRKDTTIQRLATIESAINQYVSLNKYLPCPADGTLDGTATTPSANLGSERVKALRDGCNFTNQAGGVIPWITLGLAAADAQDGWGNMFTYRVDETLIHPGTLDLTMCTPAGMNTTSLSYSTSCSPSTSCPICSNCTSATFPGSCTSPSTILAGRGLKVQNASATAIVSNPALTPSTGAAYVVISHGENQAGAYQFSGIINAGTIASGTEEAKNAANLAYGAGSYLVDDVPTYGTGTSHFDDFVLRSTILNVATKAQMGPRAY